MKKYLEILLNVVHKKDLETLYGRGSIVEINNVRYCTTTKKINIDCKLKVSDIKLYEECGYDGINYLIEESYKFTGCKNIQLSLVTSLDLVD